MKDGKLESGDRSGMFETIKRVTGIGSSGSPPSEDPLSKTRTPTPKSRHNKQAWTTYHDPAVLRALRIVSAENKISQQKLAKDALNEIFRKYGKPQIA